MCITIGKNVEWWKCRLGLNFFFFTFSSLYSTVYRLPSTGIQSFNTHTHFVMYNTYSNLITYMDLQGREQIDKYTTE